MCGRFTLTRSAAEVAAHFDVDDPAPLDALGPRWNAAPGQAVAAVRATAPGGESRRVEARPWGLRSRRATAPGPASLLVNARAETAARRPTFREAARHRRCLVPADGFFEWRGARGSREPFHVTLPDGGLFGMAALHDEDDAEPGALVVLTTPARGPVRALHDRMPVLVPPSAWAVWLDPTRHDAPAALEAALSGDAAGSLVVRPVSRRVNDVAHDDPDCLAPPEEPGLPFG